MLKHFLNLVMKFAKLTVRFLILFFSPAFCSGLGSGSGRDQKITHRNTVSARHSKNVLKVDKSMSEKTFNFCKKFEKSTDLIPMFFLFFPRLFYVQGLEPAATAWALEWK